MEPVEDEHIPLIVNWEEKFPTMVGSWSSERHALALRDPDCCYRLIRFPNGSPAGFLLLCGVTSPDRNVELKRVVVGTRATDWAGGCSNPLMAMVFDDLGAHRL
jgi:hypothetical protein